MGFFSVDCPGCGHSIRPHAATREESRWMCDAVGLSGDGDRVGGEYDGYGRINRWNTDGAEVWHRACYTLAGRPDFTKPSRHARDQGYFVGEYDPPMPTTPEAVAALRGGSDRQREEARRSMTEARAKRIAELKAKGESVPEWLRES